MMKKVISIVLALVLTLGVCGMTASAALETVGGFGDTDQDGAITANDALMILKSVVGKVQLNQAELCFSDLNTDYEVNTQDALLILQRVVGKLGGFTADDDHYVSISSYNAVEVRNGGSVALKLEVESEGEGENLFALYNSEALSIGTDGGLGTINLTISPKVTVAQRTVFPIAFYIENHPSIYKMVNVVVLP